MSGLDTRGAWDGFVQGFQLVDNYQARQVAQQNAKEQLGMQQRGLDMREQEMAVNQNLAQKNQTLRERELSENSAYREKQYGLDERRLGIADKQFERQMSADNRRLGMQERELGLRLQDRDQEQDMQILRGGYAKIAEGQELGDEELTVFKRYPWLAPNHVADPKMNAAVARAAKVLDPKDPADANDPESLEAINYMFGPRIQRGDGGKKKIVGVYPGQVPGTLAFELEVTGEDGKPYRAPMTKNRGTADDDEVMQVPIEDVVNQVAGYKTLSGVLQSAGGRDRAVSLGQRLGLLDQFDAKGVPADVQTAKWLVNSGGAPDVQSAWSMVRGARGKSRQDFALDYAKMLTKDQDPLSEQKVSPDDAFQTGLQMYDRLNGAQEGATATDKPQPPGAPGAEGAPTDEEIRALNLW